MARDVGEYAKKMKVSGGKGKTLPAKTEVDDEGSEDAPVATLRPAHMVELMKSGDTHDADGNYVCHEADEGEDPKYHEAVKAFQKVYEGSRDDEEGNE